MDFSDISENHWAAAYIAYCVENGYIVGYDGKFHPDDNLTGYAWAKIVICSLGYDAAANGLVGDSWKTGVDNLAKELNLLNNLTNQDLSKDITREDACQLLYNSLGVTTLGHYAASIDEINRVFAAYESAENNFYKYSRIAIADEEVWATGTNAEKGTDAAESITGGMSIEADVASAAAEGYSPNHSNTNVQVAGIDEADIVKTDGRYIYYIHSNNYYDYNVTVVDTKDNTKVINNLTLESISATGYDKAGNKLTLTLDDEAEELNVEYKGKSYNEDEFYKLDVEFNLNMHYKDIENIYICDNKLIVVYSDYAEYAVMNPVKSDFYNDYESSEITYIEVYSISDPNNITLLYTLGQDGGLDDTRLLGNKLYVVSTTGYGYYWNYADDEEDYDYIPKTYVNEKASEIPVNHIYLTESVPYYISYRPTYSVVGCFDLVTGTLSNIEAILGDIDIVYMNYDNLYLTRYSTDYRTIKEFKESIYDVTTYKSQTLTSVFKYDITNGLRLTATAEIPGYLESQFSIDEYNGVLRAVTHDDSYEYSIYVDKNKGFTNYEYSDSEDANGVYTYDKDLNPLGSLTGLAKDENVYSVRFDKEVVYFCTFRQIDPLFSVDLTDPANPKLMGALKITGFSEYLHNWSDNLLLGFGKSATDTGFTTGLQLVMFDTTDKFDVKVKHTIPLEAKYSDALYNHRIILIDTNKNIIGIPTSDGYEVYSYNDSTGFKREAVIDVDYYSWNDDSRAVYIDNSLFVLTEDFIQTLDMTNFSTISIIDYDNKPYVED